MGLIQEAKERGNLPHKYKDTEESIWGCGIKPSNVWMRAKLASFYTEERSVFPRAKRIRLCRVCKRDNGSK